ncbi:Centromere protein V [Orchesella cincta]|uniref:Centromere protein V n=1 Tax=Orchesella cincta TaxID=48709 RepID=A0A1D2MGC2_ORCCI|nr:Centromere protein V [Orchesella cincta]
MSENPIEYRGSCHCGAVKFSVLAPETLRVVDCNCSVCTKKQNKHFIVPASDFKLVSGASNLKTYTFGTNNAKHTFCSECGVQSFYTPRSDSNAKAIMPHCIDKPLPLKYYVDKFDGQNWEDAIKTKVDIVTASQKQ